jgi:transcriptional regulator with XRE-family HTH domain
LRAELRTRRFVSGMLLNIFDINGDNVYIDCMRKGKQGSRTRKTAYAAAPPAAVERAVAELGASIATARLRRRWPQEELAAKAGITRPTLVAVEQGKLGTGIGAYVAVLWALGLHGDLALVAAPERDLEGQTLEASRLPDRARRSTRLSDEF